MKVRKYIELTVYRVHPYVRLGCEVNYVIKVSDGTSYELKDTNMILNVIMEYSPYVVNYNDTKHEFYKIL